MIAMNIVCAMLATYCTRYGPTDSDTGELANILTRQKNSISLG